MSIHRKRTYLLGTSATYACQAITVLVGFLSVPISLRYFGTEIYAAMVVISTITTYLGITNFGLPTAVATLGAKALDEIEQARIFIKSFALLVGFTVIALMAFTLATFVPSWIAVLGKIPSGLSAEIERAAIWAALLFLANLPFTLAGPGFTALQKVHWSRIYDILTVLVSFAALLAAVSWKLDLTGFMIARGLATLAISIVATMHLAFELTKTPGIKGLPLRQLWAPPSQEEFRMGAIFLTGTRLFLVGSAAMIVWHIPNLVISNFLSLSAVTPYAVTFRLVTINFALFTTLNVALNPMYGSAFARKDYSWISRTYNDIAGINQILGGLVWLGSLMFAQDIIHWWVGPHGDAGLLCVFAFGAYGYCLSLVHTHSGILTSTNRIRNIVAIGWSEALMNLALSLLLLRFFGIGGVALGMFLGAATTVFWMLPREISRQTDGAIAYDWSKDASYFCAILAPCLLAALLIQWAELAPMGKTLCNAVLLSIYAGSCYMRLPQKIKDHIVGVVRSTANRSAGEQV